MVGLILRTSVLYIKNGKKKKKEVGREEIAFFQFSSQKEKQDLVIGSFSRI